MRPALQNDAAFAYMEGAPYDMMRVNALRDSPFTRYVSDIASLRRNEHGVTAVHEPWTFAAAGVGMTPAGRFIQVVLSPEGAITECHYITLKDVDRLLRAAVAANNKCNERILNIPPHKPEGGGAHGRR